MTRLALTLIVSAGLLSATLGGATAPVVYGVTPEATSATINALTRMAAAGQDVAVTTRHIRGSAEAIAAGGSADPRAEIATLRVLVDQLAADLNTVEAWARDAVPMPLPEK